jgi:plastocyanin
MAVPSSSMASGGMKMPANAPMITIKDFMFAVTGKIHPGEKIMVMNQDSEAHTVTADSGNAFNVAVPASSTATLTAPSKAGTYKFHCNIHSNMHGVLTVG